MDRNSRNRYRPDSPSRRRSSSRERYRDRRRPEQGGERRRSRSRESSYDRNPGRSDTNRDRDRDKIHDADSKSVKFDGNSIKKDEVKISATGSNSNLPLQENNSHKHNLDDVINEEELEVLEAFMNNDEEIERQAELQRLERKRRRDEILSHHNTAVEQDCITKMAKSAIHFKDSLVSRVSPVNFSCNAKSSASSRYLAVDGDESMVTVPTMNDSSLNNKETEEETFIQLANEKSAIEAENNSRHQSNFTFDIFSSSPTDIEKISKRDNQLESKQLNKLNQPALKDSTLETEDPHLQSNWDDGEGYYKARIGEIVQESYRILGVVGKGVFSTVLKCADLTKPKDVDTTSAGPDSATIPGVNVTMGMESKYESVAIKLIRNNETMRKAAEKEFLILALLSQKDPNGKKHCVQLFTKFEYRNHIAFVFEYQSMNLREALKKFGKDVGINIGAIRLYSRQLFIALKYLFDLKIVHADIKPDNILCSADLKSVKLCDFGSAFFETDAENVPTPYLVSRFYRAPEIILGQAYDHSIDLWSVGVTMCELYTGHVMFPGRSNNEMLKLIMAIKGRFSNKQLKSHIRQFETMGIDPHFDNDLRFKQYELDPVTGNTIMRLVDVVQPTRDLTAMLRSNKAGADDGRLVSSFANLLEQCLILDPTKRISVQEALKHAFFTMK